MSAPNKITITAPKKSPLPIKGQLSVTVGDETVSIRDDDVTVIVRK